MDGLMDNSQFFVVLTVFHSYYDDEKMIMKDKLGWNPFYGYKDYRFQLVSNSRPLDQ